MRDWPSYCMCVWRTSTKPLHCMQTAPHIFSKLWGNPTPLPPAAISYVRTRVPIAGPCSHVGPPAEIDTATGLVGIGCTSNNMYYCALSANIIRVNNMTRVTRQKINICLVVHPSHYFIHLIFSRNLISTDLSRRFQPRSASDWGVTARGAVSSPPSCSTGCVSSLI